MTVHRYYHEANTGGPWHIKNENCTLDQLETKYRSYIRNGMTHHLAFEVAAEIGRRRTSK